MVLFSQIPITIVRAPFSISDGPKQLSSIDIADSDSVLYGNYQQIETTKGARCLESNHKYHTSSSDQDDLFSGVAFIVQIFNLKSFFRFTLFIMHYVHRAIGTKHSLNFSSAGINRQCGRLFVAVINFITTFCRKRCVIDDSLDRNTEFLKDALVSFVL